VSKRQLRRLATEGKGGASLGSWLPIRQIPALHPDLPLETALRYVDRWSLAPVVSRADFRQLEGVITQRDVLDRWPAVWRGIGDARSGCWGGGTLLVTCVEVPP